MSGNSSIEWTDATWNPVTGCDRTSPGCDHCYALTLAKRLKAMGNPRYQVDGDDRTSGPGFGVTMHEDKLDEPLRWRTPRRIFVNSMSDLFHPDVPDLFITQVFDVMAEAGHHVFQVLTKRPQRMAALTMRRQADRHEYAAKFESCPTDAMRNSPASVWANEKYHIVSPNIWLGTSIESDRYTFRADHLRATPAAVRFLSLEPLLGALPSLDLTGIDWVIVGGESGPGARPMHPDWVRDIRDRCVALGVPFFFKQWGAWRPLRSDEAWGSGNDMPVGKFGPPSMPLDSGPVSRMRRVGKHEAGRLLDGLAWDEMPAVAA